LRLEDESLEKNSRVLWHNQVMKVINIDKEILGGTPVFNGTRVPVKNLFDYLETGETIDEFLEDFPSVKREQIIELLQFSERTLS
jgi:uncharacterized protein (DUF433 family)